MNKLSYETDISEHSSVGRVTFEYAQDATFDEIFEIFRQMALCMGFHEETVREYFEPDIRVVNNFVDKPVDEITDCDVKMFTNDEQGNNLNKPLNVDKIDIS